MKLVIDGGRSVPEVAKEHELGKPCVYTRLRKETAARVDSLPGGLTSS